MQEKRKKKRDKLLNACITSEGDIFHELKKLRKIKDTVPITIDGTMAYCRNGRVCRLVKLRISMIRTFSFGNISHITLYAQLEIV